MSLGIKPFERGLHDLGSGGYAWLQPDGGWGWSNARLIVSQGEAQLVDTLFDVRLTHEMLNAMRAAAHIDTLVNTHANDDRCNGNELVADAEIISSRAAAGELASESPERIAEMMRRAPDMGRWASSFSAAFATSTSKGFVGRRRTHVVNVATLYREFGDAAPGAGPAGLFALMAKIHKARRR